MNKKYYIIAGEASGDLHGGNLVAALKRQDPGSEIRCWGGDKMQQAGATLVKHYRELAFMGFLEVVLNLGTILKNLKFCKEDILSHRPDVLVLVDYPGFNLRIAKWAQKQNIKVVYYISPQVWAWKENRAKMMRQCIDKMLVILPFEKKYFKEKWNWDVTYTGHPLIEEIDKRKEEENNLSITLSDGTVNTKPIVALLPGSRKQEIEKKLPVMLKVSTSFPNYQFVVAQAPALDKSFYETFTLPFPNVSIVNNRTYDLLKSSAAALVTSGTATLETALFNVPEVVCYKGSEISYQIAKRVINIKYISLVNLIMDKEVVKELIQGEMNVENLCRELDMLLHNQKKKEQIKNDYAALKSLLSSGGNASEKAATIIVDLASQ
ncbi:MAG TPA: lipid-A-disaccharide synthase [Niabella sp.]|nr:lipid-A-disaccharide synthase [Niabella sp.]HQW14228.1 lipid-A-disaccharide synthase [Niabella sp.]HQX19628.1 lipid-A-disaccharide synthase [Niabella sp.]HQX39938.1 lipid-A-disaccharide synthase [Niabella sp.]HRB06931.1 lipid-A-disaccharide synthase [Niabella sp.]